MFGIKSADHRSRRSRRTGSAAASAEMRADIARPAKAIWRECQISCVRGLCEPLSHRRPRCRSNPNILMNCLPAMKSRKTCWIEQTEGAKFWLKVMNELKNRGVQYIVFAVVDGLKGFPDAITAAFPQAVQTCIVHLPRHSLNFVSWQDRKRVVPDLGAIYRA